MVLLRELVQERSWGCSPLCAKMFYTKLTRSPFNIKQFPVCTAVTRSSALAEYFLNIENMWMVSFCSGKWIVLAVVTWFFASVLKWRCATSPDIAIDNPRRNWHEPKHFMKEFNSATEVESTVFFLMKRTRLILLEIYLVLLLSLGCPGLRWIYSQILISSRKFDCSICNWEMKISPFIGDYTSFASSLRAWISDS